jgi:hypothetical protein
MICGTFQKTGLDQATADLIAQGYGSTSPAPLNVNTTQAVDGSWTVTAIYPPCPANVLHAQLNLTGLTPGQQSIATQIASAFAQAGFGTLQQAAAIANAMAESSLNPAAQSPAPEDSVGLFQLNIGGGLGAGYTPAQLKDPVTNIQIILSECQKYPGFGSSTDIATANQIFVSQIERPADIPGQIAKRLSIAEGLLT